MNYSKKNNMLYLTSYVEWNFVTLKNTNRNMSIYLQGIAQIAALVRETASEKSHKWMMIKSCEKVNSFLCKNGIFFTCSWITIFVKFESQRIMCSACCFRFQARTETARRKLGWCTRIEASDLVSKRSTSRRKRYRCAY